MTFARSYAKAVFETKPSEEDKALAKRCKDLLKDRLDGKITQEGLELAMAKITVEMKDLYKRKPLPTKPAEYLRYESQDIKSKGELYNRSMRDCWQFREYVETENLIKGDNYSNKVWLERCITILAEHEMRNEMLILTQVLNTYET